MNEESNEFVFTPDYGGDIWGVTTEAVIISSDYTVIFTTCIFHVFKVYSIIQQVYFLSANPIFNRYKVLNYEKIR